VASSEVRVGSAQVLTVCVDAQDPEADQAVATESRDWVADLTSPGRDQDQALRDLHGLMIRAARHQVWRMKPMLGGAGHDTCEELANQAADDALASLLAKMHTFQGQSRFTTWAYKFAILQAAAEVRRHAWRNREVRLETRGFGRTTMRDPKSMPRPSTWPRPWDGPWSLR
jgi:RNA polymerase sigma-70 factor (ECF subfamily)